MACCQLQAAGEEKLQSRDRARGEDLILRVLSVKKKDNQILVLAINKDSQLVYGCIDSKAAIDDITADTMVKYNGVLDNNYDDTFSMLVFQDDYIRAIGDDPLFPTFNSIKTNIDEIRKNQSLPRITQTCCVDAIIVSIPRPDPDEKKSVNIAGSGSIDMVIGDSTGQVSLNGQYDMPEELNEGDKIKVIGACVIPVYTVWSTPYDADYEITNIALKMHPYGSILKIPKYTPSTNDAHLMNHQ